MENKSNFLSSTNTKEPLYLDVMGCIQKNSKIVIQPLSDETNRSRPSTTTFNPRFLDKSNVQSLTSCNKIYPLNDIPDSIGLIKIRTDVKQKEKIDEKDIDLVCFPTLEYKLKDLVYFSKMIILGSSQRKEIARKINLDILIKTIASNYNDVPYHNFSHGFSLLLMLHQCFQRSERLRKIFNETQIFYAYIAALSHDLNHKGTNNSFEVKRQTPLALLSKNQSVLENMHINHLWSILRKCGQINFLQAYTTSEAIQIKKMITVLILSTDVCKHFDNLEKLKVLKWDEQMNFQDQSLLFENVFHACDIGNPCLDFDNYINWSALLSLEFNNQAYMEQKMGLAVSPFFKYANKKCFYQGQIGFINGLVMPLWKHLNFVLPGLKQFTDNIDNNIVELKNCIKQEEDQGQKK